MNEGDRVLQQAQDLVDSKIYTIRLPLEVAL